MFSESSEKAASETAKKWRKFLRKQKNKKFRKNLKNSKFWLEKLKKIEILSRVSSRNEVFFAIFLRFL